MAPLDRLMGMFSEALAFRLCAGTVAASGLAVALIGALSPRPDPALILTGLTLAAAGGLFAFQAARMARLRKKAEELNASELRLRQVSRYREHFLANMSHEFRTPLNAIQGFAQAILHRQDEMTPEQIAEYLRIIDRSARNLAALTDNALDLSRLDATGLRLATRDIDFSALIGRIVGRYSARAAERNIKLHCDFAEDWIVRADPGAVKRSLESLLSNALKFSEDGRQIDIRLRRSGRRSFAVEVADRGCGMTAEELDTIWIAYARCSRTKKTAKIGARLGLAVARSLMEAHGGYIEIVSRVGEGTTARLCFPNTMIVGSAVAPESSQLVRRIAI